MVTGKGLLLKLKGTVYNIVCEVLSNIWQQILAVKSGTWEDKQELSYRKQIARQLRTHYVEGIYRPKYCTVTLKSKLWVARGHWKRNHWIDHILELRVYDVEYYRDLEMRVSGHQLWVSGTIWKLGYGFLFAFHSNYGRIFSHLASKNGLTLKSGFGVVQGHWKGRGLIDHVWLSISPPL